MSNARARIKTIDLIKRSILKIRVDFINSVGNAFMSDEVSNRIIRPALLRSLGLKIGEGTSIERGSWFGGPAIKIGKKCFINKNCLFDGPGAITIEDDVVLSFGVTIFTAHHPIGNSVRRCSQVTEIRDVTVGRGTFFGANVTVLPGVKIGKGCIIGAGAVVTKSIPDDVIAAGVPAKTLRKLQS